MSKTHKQWMRECIEECKTCGNLNTASGAERLIEKFAEHMDEPGSGLPEGGAPFQQLVTDSNGVAKWEDKPFGDMSTFSDTLTWDGTIGERYTVSTFVHMSDVAPSVEDFSNGCRIIWTDGTETNVTEYSAEEINSKLDLENLQNGVFCDVNRNFVVVLQEGGTAFNYTFEKKGVYLNPDDPWYPESFTVNGFYGFKREEYKTIDPKYLPDMGGGAGLAVRIFIPEDALDASGTCTFDKSYNEVYAALKAHKNVVFYQVTDEGKSFEGEFLWNVRTFSVESISLYQMNVFTGEVNFSTIDWYSDRNLGEYAYSGTLIMAVEK